LKDTLNTILRYQFDQLEKDRISLLKTLGEYPEDILNLKPGLEKWSVNQILIHLLTSEQLTLNYLKKKSLGINTLKDSGILTEARLSLLKISQRLPIRFKAPKFLKQNTPEPLPLPELTNRWNDSRNELLNFLESIGEENLRKLIYKHPVAGRFNILQCLVFLQEHFHHHLPQVKRILQNSRPVEK
jgi:uncharacterized damage-inducible protein DinB